MRASKKTYEEIILELLDHLTNNLTEIQMNKALNTTLLERKLPNGLTEVREYYPENGQVKEHYFLNENSERCGECKCYNFNGQLKEVLVYV